MEILYVKRITNADYGSILPAVLFDVSDNNFLEIMNLAFDYRSNACCVNFDAKEVEFVFKNDADREYFVQYVKKTFKSVSVD